MSSNRVAVRNAGDAQQVKKAAQAERFALEQFALDLAEVMALSAGRRVLWHLLGQAKVHSSVFDAQSPQQTAYNAGRQDFGHFIIRTIVDCDPAAWLLMQRESMQAEQNQLSADDTPRAEDDSE